MTKRFCDLCGAPAAEDFPEFFQDGYGYESANRITVRAIFEVVLDSQNCIKRASLDLCGLCQEHLLTHLILQIKAPKEAKQ
jgi:hypothetical protein